MMSNSYNQHKTKSHFRKLLYSMLKIGVIGFGGGSALIPVIEDEVVERQQLVSKKAYDEDVISACLTPGALPVEIAAGTGRRAFGIPGMIAASGAIALPGALFTILLLSALNENSIIGQWIPMLSIGIGGFICALLVHYAQETVSKAGQEGRAFMIKNVLIMLAVLLITAESNIYHLLGLELQPVFGLSTLHVLCLSFFVIITIGCGNRIHRLSEAGILSILYFWCVSKQAIFSGRLIHLLVYLLMVIIASRHLITDLRGGQGHSIDEMSGTVHVSALFKEAGAWLLFILVLGAPAILLSGNTVVYMIRGMFSSFMSFGGGDAYLSVADGMFVESQMVSASDFYGTLVPIANALPGSILCKILPGVGFLYGQSLLGTTMGGYLTALAGFGVSVAASGFIFCIVCWIFRTFEDINALRQISLWIRPIISGILLNVCLSVLRTGMQTGESLGMAGSSVLIVTLGIIVVELVLLNRKKKVNNLVLILMAVVIGLAAGQLL